MSRVDPIPTYKNSTLGKLFSLVSQNSDVAAELIPQCKFSFSEMELIMADARSLAESIEGEFHAEDAEFHAIASQYQKFSRVDDQVKMLYTSVIKDVSSDAVAVLGGSDAVQYLFNEEVKTNHHCTGDSGSWVHSVNTAASYLARIVNGQMRLNETVMASFSSMCTMDSTVNHLVARSDYCQRVFMAGPPSRHHTVSRAYFNQRHNVDELQVELQKDPCEALRERDTRAGQYFAGADVRYLADLMVVKIGRVMCVLSKHDRHKFAWQVLSYTNAIFYATFHRTAEVPQDWIRKRVYAVRTAIQDMSAAMARFALDGDDTHRVTRAMHVAHSARVQAVGEGDDEFKGMCKERADKIMSEASQVWGGCSRVCRVLESSVQSELEALDLLKCYQVFTARDADISVIADNLRNAKSKTIKPDRAEWNKFMNYVKAHDIAMYVNENKKAPSTVGDPIDPKWLEDALVSGPILMPPVDSWGKTAISKAYPWIRTADSWYLKAKDATHVTQSGEIENELVYAIKNGSKVDNGKTYQQIIDEWEKDPTYHKVKSNWAAKAEASKHIPKVRGTASASAFFRRAQSELEDNIKVMNQSYSSIVLGKGPLALAKAFKDISAGRGGATNHLVSSHDISSWSPHQDRETFIEYMEYQISKFQCPNPAIYRVMWENIWWEIRKQGTNIGGKLEDGGVQGWPGHQDSRLHADILNYCHMILLSEKLVSGPAIIRACIDDALYDMMVACRAHELAKRWRDIEAILVKLYRKLGYEVDTIKSLVGSDKFIFLNTLFFMGCEVPYGLKTFLKIGKITETAIRSVEEDCGAVFAAGRASMSAGADPFVSYFRAVQAAFFLRRGYARTSWNPHVAAAWAYLPAPGWGFETLNSFVTGEEPDMVLDRVTCWSMCDCRDDLIDGAFYQWYTLGIQVADPSSIFLDPMNIPHIGCVSSIAYRRRVIYNAVKRTQVCDELKDLFDDDWNDVVRLERRRFLGLSKVDLPTLVALSTTWADSYIQSQLDKMTSQAVCLEYMKYTAIHRHNRITRKMDTDNTGWIMDLGMTSAPRSWYALSTPAVKLVEQMREVFFASCTAGVVNHTYVSPSELVYISTEEEHSKLPCIAACSAMSYKKLDFFQKSSMYYGRSDRGYSAGSKAGAAVEAAEDSERAMHPATRKIVRAHAIFNFLDEQKADSAWLRNHFNTIWGLPTDFSINSAKVVADSSKRLPGNPVGRTHVARLFRSTRGVITCNLDALWPALEGTMADFVSTIEYIRTVMALCMSLAWSDGVAKDAKWIITVAPAYVKPRCTLEGLFSMDLPHENDAPVTSILPYSIVEGAILAAEAALAHARPVMQASSARTVAITPLKHQYFVSMSAPSAKRHGKNTGNAGRSKRLLDTPTVSGAAITPARIRSMITNRICDLVERELGPGGFSAVSDYEGDVKDFPGKVIDSVCTEDFWRPVYVDCQTRHNAGLMLLGAAINSVCRTSKVNTGNLHLLATTLGRHKGSVATLIKVCASRYAGSRAADYRAYNSEIIVSRNPTSVNGSRRMEEFNRIHAADISRLTKVLERAESGSNYDFKRGRLDARNCVYVYTDEKGKLAIDVIRSMDAFVEMTRRTYGNAVTRHRSGKVINVPSPRVEVSAEFSEEAVGFNRAMRGANSWMAGDGAAYDEGLKVTCRYVDKDISVQNWAVYATDIDGIEVSGISMDRSLVDLVQPSEEPAGPDEHDIDSIISRFGQAIAAKPVVHAGLKKYREIAMKAEAIEIISLLRSIGARAITEQVFTEHEEVICRYIDEHPELEELLNEDDTDGSDDDF